MKSIYEDKLEELIVLSSKIIKIYDKLYNLEINNQKDSLEYKKNLSYLKLLTEIEDEIYQHLDDESINNYINSIKETNTNITLSDLSVIINDKSEIFILKRILNRLRFETKRKLLSNSLKEDNINIFNSLFINQLIYEDILQSFIYETELSIEKINNKEYQKALHMIKYIISFLNKSLENKLKYDFNVPNKLFLTSKIAANNYDIDNNKYKQLIQQHYLEYINREICNIGNIDIYTSSYSFEEYKLILQKNLIKAYISIDNDNSLLKRKLYDKIIDDDEVEELLEYQNPNLYILQAERLEIYGNSKRF